MTTMAVRSVSSDINLSTARIPFGKYEGVYLHVVKHGYLQWLARQSSNMEAFIYKGVNWVELARQELKRRGTSYDSIPPSYHAIDRFSTRYAHKWVDRSKGIASTLAKMGDDAWLNGKLCGETPHLENIEELIVHKYHDGITYVFHCDRLGNPINLRTIV